MEAHPVRLFLLLALLAVVVVDAELNLGNLFPNLGGYQDTPVPQPVDSSSGGSYEATHVVPKPDSPNSDGSPNETTLVPQPDTSESNEGQEFQQINDPSNNPSVVLYAKYAVFRANFFSTFDGKLEYNGTSQAWSKQSQNGGIDYKLNIKVKLSDKPIIQTRPRTFPAEVHVGSDGCLRFDKFGSVSVTQF